jgi:hypothetical protein
MTATPRTPAVENLDTLADGALLSLNDVSSILQRSRCSIYRDIRAGRLALVKIGTSSRVRVGDLRRLIGA